MGGNCKVSGHVCGPSAACVTLARFTAKELTTSHLAAYVQRLLMSSLQSRLKVCT